ncbi:MAG: GGDEF domain-containing protein [Lachnospiraceae bacterium]|nr:GGDEF domain-containing protein [Lachnospiraceae bacterium]
MIIKNQLHIVFYGAALAISVTVLLFTIVQKRTDRPQNKWFVTMLAIVIANAMSATGSAFIEPRLSESLEYVKPLLYFQNAYFIVHAGLAPALYNYVQCVTGKAGRKSLKKKTIENIPFIFIEIFTMFNPIYNNIFYYDSNMVFHRNWGEYLLYGIAGLYFALSIGELLFSWRAITFRRRIALTYFFMLALVGILAQLFFIDIKSELFAEALAMMGAMLAVESEDDRVDPDTNIYNRRAMQMDLQNALIMRDNLPLIYVKILNAHIIERITRSANDDVMAIACSDYLKTLIPRYHIYHPNAETFVLMCSGVYSQQITEMAQKIKKRFEQEWIISNTSFYLEAAVIEATLPHDISTDDDAFYVADSIIPESVGKNRAELAWIMRRAEIERTIRNCVLNNSFEVYYQPTYDLKNYKLYGAEALVRMTDKSIGYVSPEEFIPITEQIGLVDQIDDFVIHEVCKFIRSGVPQINGIKAINVNLSVIQCMRPGFFEHIMSIVDSYNLDRSMLNFEITESVGAEDYATLSEVIHKIKGEGFAFYMDDYGTGYSNMDGIFSLEFDVIKIDKSILWNAQKESRGRVILENSIHMIHDLGCKVLVEGVETEEQVAMLQNYGVDYLQGYYFSQPVSKDRFVEFIGAQKS